MNNVSGMDGLGDAISEAWDSGEIRGSQTSEPTGRAISDPMEAAANIAAYELARDPDEPWSAAEMRARSNGDVELAAQAVEAYENAGHEDDMIRHGIPEELWADPAFNRYVADAEGDIGLAAERWDAEVTDQLNNAQAFEEQQYNEAMAYLAQAISSGEVDYYTLPADVQAQVSDWAETEEALTAVQELENATAAAQLGSAQEVVSLGEFVGQEGGNVDVYAFMIDQGYSAEDAANVALQAAPGQAYTFYADTGELVPADDTFDGATDSLVHDVRR